MCDAVILDPMQRMVPKTVKRDWQVYDLYRKDEETLFLEKAKELIWSLPPPYKPKHSGRPLYNPRSMAMIERAAE